MNHDVEYIKNLNRTVMDALKHARHRVKNVREQTQNPSRETETFAMAGKRKLRRKTCGSLTGPGCVAELRKVSDRKEVQWKLPKP